jgi:hypothetical protein
MSQSPANPNVEKPKNKPYGSTWRSNIIWQAQNNGNTTTLSKIDKTIDGVKQTYYTIEIKGSNHRASIMLTGENVQKLTQKLGENNDR